MILFGYLGLLIILGAVVGSFVSVISYRLPKRLQFIKGRSFCPNCKRQIAWYDNIPIVSYFLLGGRCRNCKLPISLRYPVIEASTAIVFTGIGFYTKDIVLLFFLLTISTLLIVIFVIDLEHQIIPDSLVFSLLIITYSLLIITSPPDFFTKVASSFGAALFLLLVHLATRGRGMGLGDVKLAIFGGLFFGPYKGVIWLFVSFLTGAIVGLILILLGKAHFGKQIAFGPFLVLSFFITLFFGNYLKYFIQLP